MLASALSAYAHAFTAAAAGDGELRSAARCRAARISDIPPLQLTVVAFKGSKYFSWNLENGFCALVLEMLCTGCLLVVL